MCALRASFLLLAAAGATGEAGVRGSVRAAAEARLRECESRRHDLEKARATKLQQVEEQAAVDALSKSIDRHGEDLAVWEKDVNAVTQVREMEHLEYMPLYTSLSAAIDELERSLAALTGPLEEVDVGAAAALDLVRASPLVSPQSQREAAALQARGAVVRGAVRAVVRGAIVGCGVRLGELQAMEAQAQRAYDSLMHELAERSATASAARLAALASRARARVRAEKLADAGAALGAAETAVDLLCRPPVLSV